VVVVDAHLDFREQYMDNPHSHACVTRRIFEKWGKDSILVIGARSGCREEYLQAKDMGLKFFTSQHVYSRGILEVIDAWDSAISLRERPIYLSIDIDGIDPAYAPGTGTPEPWGLTTWDVLRLMEELHSQIRAIDVMEVSPNIEEYITPGLAGKLLRQMVGLKEMTIRHPTWLEKV
jgi:arginase family enzyme